MDVEAVVAALALALESGFKATVAHLDRSGVRIEVLTNGVRVALLSHVVATLGHAYDGFPDGLLEMCRDDLGKLAAAYNARVPKAGA